MQGTSLESIIFKYEFFCIFYVQGIIAYYICSLHSKDFLRGDKKITSERSQNAMNHFLRTVGLNL